MPLYESELGLVPRTFALTNMVSTLNLLRPAQHQLS